MKRFVNWLLREKPEELRMVDLLSKVNADIANGRTDTPNMREYDRRYAERKNLIRGPLK